MLLTYSGRSMFKNSNDFSMHIEKIVKMKKMPYMDAVLEYCEQNFLEPSDVSKLINKSLKAKIEMEFRDANMLPKQATLDI